MPANTSFAKERACLPHNDTLSVVQGIAQDPRFNTQFVSPSGPLLSIQTGRGRLAGGPMLARRPAVLDSESNGCPRGHLRSEAATLDPNLQIALR